MAWPWAPVSWMTTKSPSAISGSARWTANLSLFSQSDPTTSYTRSAGAPSLPGTVTWWYAPYIPGRIRLAMHASRPMYER